MPFNLDPSFLKPSDSKIIAKLAGVAKTIAEGAAQRDSERILVHAEVRAVAETGALAIRVPAALGGPGGSLTDVMRVIFEVAKADPNVSQPLLPHFSLIESLVVLGKPGRRETFARALLDNKMFGGAFAERGTKFVGEMKVKLQTTADGYRIGGTKHYSTGALYSDYINTVAANEDGDYFMITMPVSRPGITLVDDWNGMGQRLTASGTTIFDDVRIDTTDLTPMGGGDNRRNYLGAYSYVMHAALDAGIAAGALADARAAGRKIGRPVPQSGVEHSYEDPYVLQAVGELATWTNIGIAMVERAASLLDDAAAAFIANEPADDLISAAVIAGSEARAATDMAAMRVTTGLYSVAGASAADRKLNLDRHWRNARTHLQHDPIAYRYKTIGEYYLNAKEPSAAVSGLGIEPRSRA